MTAAFLRLCWANRAAIGLALLLGLVWAWHRGQIAAAVDVTRTKLREQAQVDALESLVAAQGNWIANTQLLNSLAAADERAVVQRLASMERLLRSVQSEYSRHETAAPLADGCFADAPRVQYVNEGLQR